MTVDTKIACIGAGTWGKNLVCNFHALGGNYLHNQVADVTVSLLSFPSGVKIQNNVSVYEGVTLEDHVFCGPSMVFTNVFNPRSEIRRMEELRPTLVRRGASLGANCTVVCGVTIGQYAFIGAGAVVLKEPVLSEVEGCPRLCPGRGKPWPGGGLDVRMRQSDGV